MRGHAAEGIFFRQGDSIADHRFRLQQIAAGGVAHGLEQAGADEDGVAVGGLCQLLGVTGVLERGLHLRSEPAAFEFDCCKAFGVLEGTVEAFGFGELFQGFLGLFVRDEEVGSLEPGKYADLIVLSGNPLTAVPDALLEMDVLLTMVGGRVEFCAPDHADLCPSFPGEDGTAVP